MADQPTHASGGLPADESGPSAAAAATTTTTTTTAKNNQGQGGPGALASHFGEHHELSLSSRAVHADDYINNHRAVAPPLHVSTTYRYNSDPDQLRQWDNTDEGAPYDSHIYSRDSAPNTTRLEAVLSSLLGGPAVTYASGLAAFHALLVFLNPRRIAISGGYHGCHGVVDLVSKLTGLERVGLEEEGEGEGGGGLSALRPGDVIHVETPLNPTGEARDLAHYARRARELGCYLTVDATFGPPPLQRPFDYGVDVILHSGTKYIGGHSDLLCGVLVVNPARAGAGAGAGAAGGDGDGGWVRGLLDERLFLGSVMGSLEGWLGVRSLRTLEIRVERQSRSATRLVSWLDGELRRGEEEGGGAVSRTVAALRHASLQPEARVEGSWLRRQMPNGWGPVFSIIMKDERYARRLPSKLHLFHHATSLGGVESLIEWRAVTDKSVAKTVLRVSVGVEGWEDLREDLSRGFQALLDEEES